MPGNDGRALILVPDDVEPVRTPVQSPVHTPAQADGEETADRAHDGAERAFTAALEAIREAHATEIERLIRAKDGEIGRLTEALGRAEGRGDAIEAKLAAETARADEARKEVHEMSNRVMILQRDADRAETEAEALRTDLTIARADGTTISVEAQRLRADLAEAEAALRREAEAVERAETERKARGLLVRLMGTRCGGNSHE
jgi:chromosome segregation ATPase